MRAKAGVTCGLLLAVLLALTTHADAQGFYTVIAPRVLRPNSEYHVSVSTHGVDRTTQVTVEVGGRQDSGGRFSASQSTAVEPRTTRMIKIEVGDVGPGSYNVTARGSGGLDFVNSTQLTYVHKSYSVFVQTDKAIYKPGDTVMLRVLPLSKYLRPTVTAPIDIYISDGKGNRVKQWTRELPQRGVFAKELLLSKNPVLGTWNVTVRVLDQEFSKTFLVAEYVLPKFEVIVTAPKYATFKDSRVAVTVHSKYTYGKPVTGEATITAYPTIFSGIIQPIFQPPIRKVVPINGKASVEFDIAKELMLNEDFERPIQIDVVVEEALTGRRQNATHSITLHKHQYKLELVKTSEYFKPGLKYTAFIKLSRHDGTPVSDSKNPVKVRWGYGYDHDSYTNESHILSADGTVQLTFYPPRESNFSTLGLEAEYLDLNEWFSTISASISPSNTFLQASMKTKDAQVGSDVEVVVNCTETINSFNYDVLGRGDVLLSRSVSVPPGSKDHRFRFSAVNAMAPTAHLIVYYVRPESGEVVADALDFSVSGMLNNFVDMDVRPGETQPGSNVDITLRTKPNSYVGLLGVDQSVLLLQSGNDISMDEVENELNSYDSVTDQNDNLLSLRDARLRNRRSLFWWPGSADAGEVFEKSGAVVLTNGYVHEHTPLMQPPTYRVDTLTRLPGQWTTLKPDHGPAVALRPATRPPLAGPYAFSRIPKPSYMNARVHLTQAPAPVWLFANHFTGPDGRLSVKKKVPDTITSWVLTAFSLDSIHGLGLSQSPSKLRVFRPFFVSLDLPYNVVRGEVVAIPVVVFNYLDRDLTVDVTLDNSNGHLEIPDMSNDVDAPKRTQERSLTRRVTARANSGASTAFVVTVKRLGMVDIKVTATSPLAGDSVLRQLLVKAEGETQYYNEAIFVDLRNKNKFETNVTLKIPKNFVKGSERVEVSVVGDLLGPSIPNLASLLRMPFGCGEQNMLNFVPNIVIIEYLKNTNQLSPAIETQALRFLETGYQQELTYRHADGSFSAFGVTDPTGSTWLTAFVAKSFRAAAPYITVDTSIVKQALQWLSENQASNGSFPEVGKVHHHDMQGGAANGLALTAYTLITFLQDRESASFYRNVINKATDYIVRNMDGRLDDPYAIAICAYALQLARHTESRTAFNFLEAVAQSKDEMKWWSKPVPEHDKQNPWRNFKSDPIAVEITSYALLTYLERGLVQDALPIMRWLVTQRNSQGGFASTQDTVVALTALAQLAQQISVSPANQRAAITFKYESDSSPRSLTVNQANAMILQKEEISPSVRNVQINAEGSGFAIVQVSYSFNVDVTAPWPLFHLDPQVSRDSSPNHMQLSLCSGFTGQGNGSSNMAVMEVTLPSGYTADPDSIPNLRASPFIQRVETKDGDTVVVLYFDNMTREEYCPTVKAYRTHRVARQKPVPVTLYDYYDSSRRARMFYTPREATVCDICEGDEGCSEACGGSSSSSSAGSQRNGQPGSTSAAARPGVESSVPLAAVAALVLLLVAPTALLVRV